MNRSGSWRAVFLAELGLGAHIGPQQRLCGRMPVAFSPGRILDLFFASHFFSPFKQLSIVIYFNI